MTRTRITHTRRDQITLALVRLLGRHGLAGATMRALAAETGLTQGLLHYHFPSKHEMVLAVLGLLEERLRARIAAVEADGGRDPLDALVVALLSPSPSPDDGVALAAWVALGDAAAADEAVRVAYGGVLARLHGELAERIRARAVSTGRVVDDVAVRAWAGAALSQVEGAWRIGRLAPWVLPAGASASVLSHVLSAALGGGEALALPSSPPPVSVPAPRPLDLGLRLRARERRWLDELVATSPVDLPVEVWRTVATAYTAPDRHYHTLEHLVELAHWFRRLDAEGAWRDRRSVWLALLFHDAVQTRRGPPGDDEARSAALLGALLPDTDAAAAIIRLTATHGQAGTVVDGDAALFLDADMSVLGARRARFLRYEQGVAAEYVPLVGMDAYRAGRAAFLAGLVASPRLFRTDWFRDRLEHAARANLSRR